MSIEVFKEECGGDPVEHCYFCSKVTAYWCNKDVPVCQECADNPENLLEHVPDKLEWALGAA